MMHTHDTYIHTYICMYRYMHTYMYIRIMAAWRLVCTKTKRRQSAQTCRHTIWPNIVHFVFCLVYFFVSAYQRRLNAQCPLRALARAGRSPWRRVCAFFFFARFSNISIPTASIIHNGICMPAPNACGDVFALICFLVPFIQYQHTNGINDAQRSLHTNGPSTPNASGDVSSLTPASIRCVRVRVYVCVCVCVCVYVS